MPRGIFRGLIPPKKDKFGPDFCCKGRSACYSVAWFRRQEGRHGREDMWSTWYQMRARRFSFPSTVAIDRSKASPASTLRRSVSDTRKISGGLVGRLPVLTVDWFSSTPGSNASMPQSRGMTHDLSTPSSASDGLAGVGSVGMLETSSWEPRLCTAFEGRSSVSSSPGTFPGTALVVRDWPSRAGSRPWYTGDCLSSSPRNSGRTEIDRQVLGVRSVVLNDEQKSLG